MKTYVIDRKTVTVVHEGSTQSCYDYVYSLVRLWGRDRADLFVATGAIARQRTLDNLNK